MLERETRDPAVNAISNGHPSLPAMVGHDQYQQKKGSVLNDGSSKDVNQISYNEESVRSKDSKNIDRRVERTHRTKPLDNSNTSVLSSPCISDDVELHDLSTEDNFTEDEEIGLNAQDKRYRKRRRRKNAQLHQRVATGGETSKQEKSKADKNVLQAVLINALLIASWYLFSLSISIVGHTHVQAWLGINTEQGL